MKLNYTPNSLVGNLKVEVSEFHAERLKVIDTFDYSNVRRKVKEELGAKATEEYLEGGIKALKQYYAVALLDPKNEHAVSIYVDPFWHSHILFTRDYTKFCDDVFGQFIHHVLNRNNDQEVEEVSRLYGYTLGVYKTLFKQIDSYWWPENSREVLVCKHYEVTTPPVRENGLFPSVTRDFAPLAC